jgi:hypothetical protein
MYETALAICTGSSYVGLFNRAAEKLCAKNAERKTLTNSQEYVRDLIRPLNQPQN